MPSGLAAAAALAVVALAPAAASASEALWQLLQGGGQVVMIRHASTVPGIGDPPGFRLGDCATQRNLSEHGREEARRLGAREVTIKGDSNLVVQQLLGRFRIKQPHLKPLHARVMKLLSEFDDADVQWIPREQNRRADELSYAPLAPAKEATGAPGPGSKPSPREHSILCPKCQKPCKLTIQVFKDGSQHIRQECAEHGFVGYAPDVEPFRTLARRAE